MPNLYATLAEIRGTVPDGMKTTIVKYDKLILKLAGDVSRWIDRECKRVFYPHLQTKVLDVKKSSGSLWIPDLITLTSVEISVDDGQTYTALSASDYYATVGGDYNDPSSYTMLVINVNSTALSAWPRGQRTVRIVGIWGAADDRANAFQSTGDTVENNPLAADGTSLLVNDVDGVDIYGMFARFQAGQVLRIGNEYIDTGMTIDTGANTINIVRGRNGTTAAAHLQNVAIDVWKPPENINSATIIQCFRQMERGWQGFGDARATPDIGQLFYFKQIDPEAARKLQTYLDLRFG